MRRLKRILCALALTLPLAAAAVGCGGTGDPGAMSTDGGTDDAATNLALFTACTANTQCASGLCTQISYDRSPTPICTYQCDDERSEPDVPHGLQPQGLL